MEKEKILQRHMKLWSGRFLWGDADCFLSVFNYCNDFPRISIDLGAPWRGTYSNESGAERVLEAAGGGLAGMTQAMMNGRVPVIDEAERGDPVCVKIDRHYVAGIYLGDMTTFRLPDRGRIDLRIKHVRAWRI